MIIRPLKESDLNNIGFYFTLSQIRYIEYNPQKMIKIFEERKSQGIETIVVEKDNFIVGIASYFIETKFYRDGAKAVHIEDVAVSSDSQGEGIGKILMAHIKGVADQHDCYKAILDCSEENVEFYKKCGFRQTEVQMRYDGRE